jgi:hypothetical protein
VDANEDRHSRHEPERQPSFYWFFWDRMSRFPARYCITGCGTILAHKNTILRETPQSMNMKTKILHVSGCRSGSDCVFDQDGDLVQAKLDWSNIPNWLL